jgi:hypothetical protein
MGKLYLPSVLLDLLCNEIDNNEDTDKASLAHNAATALATCLMNCTAIPLLHRPRVVVPYVCVRFSSQRMTAHKSQSSLATDNRAQQLWSLIGSCKCDESRATIMAYVLFVFSNAVAFFSEGAQLRDSTLLTSLNLTRDDIHRTTDT